MAKNFLQNSRPKLCRKNRYGMLPAKPCKEKGKGEGKKEENIKGT